MGDWQDPYTYPDTTVLYNLDDERDPIAASVTERNSSLKRRIEMVVRPVNGAYDLAHLKEIHRRLYQDVWVWAGKTRTIEIRKGNSQFSEADDIEPQFEALHEWLVNDTALLSDPDISDAAFVAQTADLLEKINRTHPFREGNGRTQRAYLDQVASISGREFSWQNLDPRQNTTASIAAFNQRSGEPFRHLLVEALRPPRHGRSLLDATSYVTTAPREAQAGPKPISPEQLAIQKRRFPELFEEQQAQNSATDPDYVTFE